ncbi:MAG TPA: amino acid adenylation domain-containing protein, partial [Nitrospira sp.]|nr:amino acid adenylation domain-containing protein [Nitrospira sp.]
MPAETPAGSQEKIGEPFPLTEAQKEIWLAAQMGGAAALGYNESLKFDFRGAFDVELFRAAIRRILQRHPILLATFSRDGQSQQIHPGATVDVPLVDLSVEDDSIQRRKLAEIVEEAISTPFDLTTGPLLRIDIIRLSGEHHVVIWTAHHIVCDGWSAGLLVNELAKIYSASKQGTTPVLDIPSSFREYALATLDENDEMAYWRGQFSELPAPLDLPSDHPRPLVRSGRASTTRRELPLSLHQQLKRVAGQQRTTLVVMLIAGLKVLLHRLSGQSDIVIGLGAAGQALSGRNCLAGHCVNLLPIRTRLNKEAGFQENLAAIKKTVLDAYDHHGTTLGGILQNLRVPRSTARPPLVEIIFNVDRDPGADGFHGLSVKCERNPKRALHFDLFFNFVEGPHGLCVECDYNTDLFDSATIERMQGHYRCLLESVIANPDARISELQLLSPAELDRFLPSAGQGMDPYPKTLCVYEWFEQQAARSPDSIAVVCGSQTLTYSELSLRSNQLAHRLKELGAGPNQLVGLCLDRSVQMVVALLGIQKAGGAYVPIDPQYPHDRVAFMLEDSGASILVTSEALLATLPVNVSHIICLDRDGHNLVQMSTEPCQGGAKPDDLIYVIYTSGSTGKPKGVEITHQCVVNFLASMQREPGITSADRLLAVTTLSFDLAGLEMYLPLVSGAQLIIAPREAVADGIALAALLESSHATIMQATPVTWRLLLESGWKGSLQLKLLCGGEAFPRDLANRLLACANEVWNLYGPTETTIWSTIYRVDSRQGSVPIGQPIGNTDVYVLDGRKNLVPVGVAGELYIGGAGLARGYR